MEEEITLEHEINIDNERKILAYLFKHHSYIGRIEKKFFLDTNSKKIYYGLEEWIDKHSKLEFSFDTLLALIRQKYPRFTLNILKQIEIDFDDLSNIDFHIKVLKNDYVKSVVIKKALEDVLVEAKKKGKVSNEALRNFSDNLLTLANSVRLDSDLFSFQDLISSHKNLIEERDQGIVKRTLGSRYVDRLISRPAAPGEMTGVFGMKGSGKSVFVKFLENSLINKKICVASFNLEMSRESCLDRFICMRQNLQLNQFNTENINPKVKQEVLDSLDGLAGLKNYYFNDEAILSISDLDNRLDEAYEYFQEMGVLPKDEYFFATVDLAGMLTDFGDEEPHQIVRGMNNLHRIVRKKHRNMHLLFTAQANENKIRGNRFRSPDDLDGFILSLGDVRGGDGYAARSRVMISLTRPLYMKELLFPEQMEDYEMDPDIMYMNIVKQNDGKLGNQKFVFTPSLRLVPHIGDLN